MDELGVLNAVRDFLRRHGVEFAEKHHAPTYTSQQSAEARGESLSIGAKALVVKGDDRFWLLVLPADRKLDSAAVKQCLGVKKLRFADREELLALTGLVPGCVPPFGRPVLDLELLADTALLQEPKLAFNAGSLTTSIVMASRDYQRIAGARWLGLAQTQNG